jgi:hypothetical protein
MSVNSQSLKKLTIVSIDSPTVRVEAMFNPKEVSIDKSVPWSKHKNPKGNTPMLEFTNAENRTMSLELLFDTSEKGMPVLPEVEKLTTMTKIPDGVSNDKDKHPPRVMVVWGAGLQFKGVIESLGSKFTMFLPDGMPVRATCTLKIKEVDEVQLKAGK